MLGRTFLVAIGSVCAILAGASAAWGGVIDDTTLHYPWVYSVSGSISYEPSTGALCVASWPTAFNKDSTPGGAVTLDAGVFELNVTIDPTAKTVSGSLYVTGGPTEATVWEMFASERAAEFDYNFANNGQISFRFWQDGDMEAPNNGNVVVHIWAVGATGFDSSLDVAALYIDAFYLPEPGTLSLLAVCGAALLRRRKPR